MGTEVLRPQDCLVNRLKVSPPVFHRRKSNFFNGNGFGTSTNHSPSYRKPANRPDLKKSPTKEFQQQHRNTAGGHHHHHHLPLQQITTPPRRSGSAELSLYTHVAKPVISHPNPEVVDLGRVTILKRGKSLDSVEKNIILDNKSQKGSEKKTFSDKIAGGDVYAGSSIFVSPSPSCVPLPSFFNTNNNNQKSESDVSATRDLRRILGLE